MAVLVYLSLAVVAFAAPFVLLGACALSRNARTREQGRHHLRWGALGGLIGGIVGGLNRPLLNFGVRQHPHTQSSVKVTPRHAVAALGFGLLHLFVYFIAWAVWFSAEESRQPPGPLKTSVAVILGAPLSLVPRAWLEPFISSGVTLLIALFANSLLWGAVLSWLFVARPWSRQRSGSDAA